MTLDLQKWGRVYKNKKWGTVKNTSLYLVSIIRVIIRLVLIIRVLTIAPLRCKILLFKLCLNGNRLGLFEPPFQVDISLQMHLNIQIALFPTRKTHPLSDKLIP